MDFAFGTRMHGNGSRERLAWAILMVSFLAWVAAIIAIPLAINGFLYNASRPLILAVQANEGTVGLSDGNGQRDAIFVGEPARTMEGDANILTNTTDTALVSVYTPDQSQVLSRLHIYGTSNLEVLEATAPRFDISNDAYEVALNLISGRMRINLTERDGRSIRVRIATPQDGEVILEEAGQYSVQTTNAATAIIVLEGRANVLAEERGLVLVANQRAMIPVEGNLSGPLSSERELMNNGDFSEDSRGWSFVQGDIELADQAEVSSSVVEFDGEHILRFHRVGVGHADALQRQVINQDVMDYASLELFVTMRIVQQSLGVCGQQGSECPLFVRMVYDDVYSSEQEWQQGFFAVGEIVADSTPDICQFCAAPHNPHLRVPLNQIHSYQSGNLLEKLAQQNIRPRIIKSISLVASGHTFETHVLGVSLIAVE